MFRLKPLQSNPTDTPVRILVVEDETIVSLDIEHRLRTMGYHVTGLALTGAEALALARSAPPDIVLMDIRLQGPMSGIEAAEKLRAEMNVPIVYLTAYADTATLERARISEPFGYVLKPFEDRELSITIEIALYRHRAEQRLRESEAELRAATAQLEERVAQRTSDLKAMNEKLQLAIAARDRAQAERAAAQDERRRLAQEIHDSVTQSIFSLIFSTQAARRAARAGTSQPLEETLEEVEEIARQALKDLRLLLYQLRSPVLQHEGLAEALRYRLEAVETRAGIKTRLLAPPHLDITPDAEEAAYRIALEALNNSLKHAHASEVTVELRCEADELILVVADDGVGFDERTPGVETGLGLAGMQERAARLGGKLDIESDMGAGVRVTLRLNCSIAESGAMLAEEEAQ